MAVRRKTIKRLVGPALYGVMEPGDQIIAGTLAVAGPGPWLDLVIAVAGLTFGVVLVGTTDPTSLAPFWAGIATSLAPLVRLLRSRTVFVAVTQRQLICYRLSRWNNEPVRPLFSAPPVAVRVTRLRRVPGWRSVRYDGPGAEGRSLRLNVQWLWHQDLDEVLAALHAQGASVAPGSRPYV